MSSKAEKRVEDAVKSSHKKEKKRKSQPDVSKEESPSEIVAPNVNGDNGKADSLLDDEKAAKKARKAEKKRLRKESEEKFLNGSKSDTALPVKSEDRPLKRSKTGSEQEVEVVSKEERKAAKRKAKESTKLVEQAKTPESLSTAAVSTSTTNAAAARAYMEANSITIEAPEESAEKPPLPMLSFAELKGRIDERLERELERNKFKSPTPIQACCWSVLLANRDVVGIAETG